MTAAAADLRRTIERADQQYAAKNGEERAPTRYIDRIAEAVRPLFGQLTEPAVVAQIERDSAHLADELSKAQMRVTGLEAELGQLRDIAAAAGRLREVATEHLRKIGLLQEKLQDSKLTHAELCRYVSELVEAATGEPWKDGDDEHVQDAVNLITRAASYLDEAAGIGDAEPSTVASSTHRHDWVIPPGKRRPVCACGESYPDKAFRRVG